MKTWNRRSLLAAGGSLGLMAAGGISPLNVAMAQETVDMEELLVPSALGDKVLGSDDAPVSVVEYASMSCPHCAAFHKNTWDDFREKYVDSGQVKFIFREFPLNAPAYAISMLARCAPENRYFDIIHLYFERQDEWLRSDDLFKAILDLAKQSGFTQKTFEACLKNQALFDGLNTEKDRASQKFGVSGTPTFFINGKKDVGDLSLDDLDEHIQPLL